MTKLMLKALDPAECFLTRTTDKPEAAAESRAKTSPSMRFHPHVEAGNIKTNPVKMWSTHGKSHLFIEQVVGEVGFESSTLNMKTQPTNFDKGSLIAKQKICRVT
jgi:hypothetical protein